MKDDPGPQPIEGSGDRAMYRPSAEGGMEVAVGKTGDYRAELRSSRWNAAPLENPEVEKTDPRLAVAAIVILSAISLVLLVVGYGSGFWG